jgi:NTP pyrophosphatase (non-canonical NTP hydrolase)
MTECATRISRELLVKIEEVSDVKWSDGERPTEWYPPDESIDAHLILYDSTIAYGYSEEVLKEGDFVAKCAEVAPKRSSVIEQTVESTGTWSTATALEIAQDLKELQLYMRQWQAHNFPDSPQWQPLLGVQEEVGELAHAFLKRSQGIRKNEDHDANIKDAIGDIVIYLIDFCNREGVYINDCIKMAFDEIKGRDWQKYKNNGKEEECASCGQIFNDEITGEYPCKKCGMPYLHDSEE